MSPPRLHVDEAVLTKVLEALPVGVWIMDKDGVIRHHNTAGPRIWGGARYVGPDEFASYKGWWAETGDPIAAHEWAAARAITKGEVSIDELVDIECFDGTRKTILNSALPLRDGDGAIVGGIIVNQDVTARREMEQALQRVVAEKDLLLQELNHRIKNSLALVASLLGLQASGADNVVVGEQLRQAQDRILAVARLHERLYQEAFDGTVQIAPYLRELCAHLAESLGQQAGPEIQLDVDDVALAVDQAIPLGLIANELVTNAVKHGVQGVQSAIEVRLTSRNDHLRLEVADDGPGLPPDVFDNGGFGMRVIGALVRQLQGRIKVARRSSGAVVTIEMPPVQTAPDRRSG